MKYNIDGRTFRSFSNTENGEVNADTLFYYQQDGDIISAEYHGGAIKKGHLVGKQLETGQVQFVYHHINDQGELLAGKCISTPELTANGKLRLVEEWQWMTGDRSEGKSEIVEI